MLNLQKFLTKVRGDNLLIDKALKSISDRLFQISAYINTLTISSSELTPDADINFNGYSGINIDELGESGARVNKIWLEDLDILYPGSAMGTKTFNLLFNDSFLNYGLTFTASANTGAGTEGGQIRSTGGSLFFGTSSTNYFKVTSTAFSALGSYDLGNSGQYFNNAYINNINANTEIYGAYLSGTSYALISNTGKKIVESAVTATELTYLSGLTSAPGGLGMNNTWTGINTFNNWIYNSVNKPLNLYRYHSNSTPLTTGDDNKYHKICTITIDTDNQYITLFGSIVTDNSAGNRPEADDILIKIRLSGTLSSGTVSGFLSYIRKGDHSGLGSETRYKLVKTSDTSSSKIYELYIYLTTTGATRTFDVNVTTNMSTANVSFNQIVSGSGISNATLAGLGTVTEPTVLLLNYSISNTQHNIISPQEVLAGSSAARFKGLIRNSEVFMSGHLANSYAQRSITNTTKTSILSSTLLGAISIPANSTEAGSHFEVYASGLISTTSGSQDLLVELNFSNNSTVILNPTVSVPGSLTSVPFFIRANCTVRSTGASGAIIGALEICINGTYYVTNTVTSTPVTMDTTANNSLNIQVKWTNSGNTILGEQGYTRRAA